MLEYASRRLTFRWTMATQFPNTMLKAPVMANSIANRKRSGPECRAFQACETDEEHLEQHEELATFDPVAIKAATGVGAPS